MRESADDIVADAQVLIEAVDKNREALNAVLDQIHADMQHRLVVIRGPHGSRPADFKENHLGRVMLLNYVAAFLSGEAPDDDAITDTIDNFYATGLEHGSAYAGARAAHMN